MLQLLLLLLQPVRCQAVALKHEEHTALRKFKTRLAEVEAELGAERGAQGRSATDWMERTRALREELNTVQVGLS